MRRIKSEQARKAFRELLDEAERGGEIEVLRYDRTVAWVVSDEWHARATAALKQTEGNDTTAGDHHE